MNKNLFFVKSVDLERQCRLRLSSKYGKEKFVSQVYNTGTLPNCTTSICKTYNCIIVSTHDCSGWLVKPETKKKFKTQKKFNGFWKTRSSYNPETKEFYHINFQLQHFSICDLLIGYNPEPFYSHCRWWLWWLLNLAQSNIQYLNILCRCHDTTILYAGSRATAVLYAGSYDTA